MVMLWRFLINTLTVCVVARRIRARTLVWRAKILPLVSFVWLLLQNSWPRFQLRLISSKKKNVRQGSQKLPPQSKDSAELVDPASVSVIGVVGQQETVQQTDSVKSPSIFFNASGEESQERKGRF